MTTIRFEDYERELDARRAALGLSGWDYVLPNSGAYRTPKKRALLRALAESARRNGRTPKFPANF